MGFFDKIQETVTSATEQTKAKASEVQFKKERSKKLETLGEQVYNMFLNGQLPSAELAPTCQEIAELDQRLESARAAGQAARPEATAPPAPPAGPAQQPPPPPPPPPPGGPAGQ